MDLGILNKAPNILLNIFPLSLKMSSNLSNIGYIVIEFKIIFLKIKLAKILILHMKHITRWENGKNISKTIL